MGKFKWSGSGRSTVTFTLPSGESCTGEYVTVSNDEITWGQVFAVGMTPTSGYAVTSSGQQRGRGIATGDRGTTIECEYLTSAYSPRGHGSCRDNRGKTYRLMF